MRVARPAVVKGLACHLPPPKDTGLRPVELDATINSTCKKHVRCACGVLLWTVPPASSPVELPLSARGAERAQTRLARGARLPEGRASTSSTHVSAVPGGKPRMVTCRSCKERGWGRRPTGPGPLHSTAQK
jgi:hypothetical protein